MAFSIRGLPLFVRQFVFDFVQGAVLAVVGMNLAFPGTLTEAKAQAAIILLAAARALFGAAGRAVPAFLAYMATFLMVPQVELTPDPVDAPEDMSVTDDNMAPSSDEEPIP